MLLLLIHNIGALIAPPAMAKGTHLKVIDELLKQLPVTSSHQTQCLDSLQSVVSDQQVVLSELIIWLTTLDVVDQALHLVPSFVQDSSSSKMAGTSSSPSASPLTITSIQTCAMRLDFPRFDGTEPLGWILQS